MNPYTAWCPTCRERCSHITEGCSKCGYDPIDAHEERKRERLAEQAED